MGKNFGEGCVEEKPKEEDFALRDIFFEDEGEGTEEEEEEESRCPKQQQRIDVANCVLDNLKEKAGTELERVAAAAAAAGDNKKKCRKLRLNRSFKVAMRWLVWQNLTREERKEKKKENMEKRKNKKLKRTTAQPPVITTAEPEPEVPEPETSDAPEEPGTDAPEIET